MRVLFFGSIFPRPGDPNRGIQCFEWCKAIAAAGNTVRVVSPRSWLDKRPDANADRVADFPVEYPTYFYTPKVLRPAYGWFMWQASRRPLRRAIAEFRPDCILSYWIHPDGAVAARAAREAGIPSAIIIGGSDLLVLPNHSAGRRRCIIAALHATDAVIVVARYLRDRVVDLGIPAEKVHVVYQGIDLARFFPADRTRARQTLGLDDADPVLLWAGRMVPVKGLEILIEACAKLHAGGTRFRLHLVGDGPLRARLEAYVAKRGLSDSIRFAGSVPHGQLPDWYRAADLTVLSSRSEGVPNVLRESLACGTPFVSTDVGGVAELVDGNRCSLVPPADAQALADAIAEMLAHPRESSLPPHLNDWHESAAELLDVMRPKVAHR